jgi:hypothetical protein
MAGRHNFPSRVLARRQGAYARLAADINGLRERIKSKPKLRKGLKPETVERLTRYHAEGVERAKKRLPVAERERAVLKDRIAA